VLSRDKTPEIIILKECAAFFPGNEEKLKPLVKQWVKMCRENNIVPVLTTVVPVVKSYSLRMFFLSLLHLKVKWPNETFDTLISYNDWIRVYAKEENIEVLDLEAALRTGPDDRYLKSSFAKKDGLHINTLAYKELDKAIFPVLDKTGTAPK
jgi:lysophospholipase L1-like esterase